MFKLRREQMDAFRPLFRAQLPHRILADIQGQGIQAQRDDKTGDIVAADARGFQTRLSFQPDGLPSRLQQPSGAAYAFDHDSEGRLAALTYPGGERLELERDKRGNISELRRPGLLAYGLEHDDSDRLLAVRYPDGSTTRLGYHPEGPLDSLTDRTGSTTRYQRDAKGKLLSTVDPLGRETVYETDEKGRLAAVIFPDGSRQDYGFDPEARIAFSTTRSGRLVLQELDEKNRVKSIDWGDGSKNEFELDEAGNLVKARSASDEIVHTFDAQGLPLTETTSAGTVHYTYDPEGRLTRLVNPFGDVVEYEYDPDGRISVIRDWEGRENRVVYAPDGTVSEIRYGNGMVERQQYGRVGRLQQATVTDRRGRVLSEQRYSYDLTDRLTAAADLWGDQPSQRSARRFEYDAESRLTTEIDVASKRTTAQYEYDAKGNMVRDQGVLVEVGLLDEPIRHGHAAIEYDDDGNMVRFSGPQGEIRCRFNGDGTLGEASIGEKVVRFEYDALGRRILKTDGRRIWRFGWAGHQLLWEESQENPEAPLLRRDYILFPNSVTPLAFREKGSTCWLQSDVRDAVVRAFDEAGRVVWRASYDSFGSAQPEITLVTQPWRLAGQYYDSETGLHYNFARYYNPSFKSYISRDVNWHKHGASTHGYAGNDPWNKTDPFGAFWHILVAAVIGAVVNVVIALATGQDPVAAAVDGAIVGASVAIGGPFLGGAVGGFLGGTAGSVVRQLRHGDKISWECAFKEGAFEAITNVLFAFGGKALARIPAVRQFAGKLGIGLAESGENAVQRLARAEIGSLGEQAVGEDLLRSGRFKQVIEIKNANNNGIDVAAQGHNGRWTFFEVKSNTTGRPGSLSSAQSDSQEFVRSRLQDAADGTGRWKTTTQAQQDQAKSILRDIDRDGFETGRADVYMSQDGRVGRIEYGDW